MLREYTDIKKIKKSKNLFTLKIYKSINFKDSKVKFIMVNHFLNENIFIKL